MKILSKQLNSTILELLKVTKGTEQTEEFIYKKLLNLSKNSGVCGVLIGAVTYPPFLLS